MTTISTQILNNLHLSYRKSVDIDCKNVSSKYLSMAKDIIGNIEYIQKGILSEGGYRVIYNNKFPEKELLYYTYRFFYNMITGYSYEMQFHSYLCKQQEYNNDLVFNNFCVDFDNNDLFRNIRTNSTLHYFVILLLRANLSSGFINKRKFKKILSKLNKKCVDDTHSWFYEHFLNNALDKDNLEDYLNLIKKERQEKIKAIENEINKENPNHNVRVYDSPIDKLEEKKLNKKGYFSSLNSHIKIQDEKYNITSNGVIYYDKHTYYMYVKNLKRSFVKVIVDAFKGKNTLIQILAIIFSVSIAVYISKCGVQRVEIINTNNIIKQGMIDNAKTNISTNKKTNPTGIQ